MILWGHDYCRMNLPWLSPVYFNMWSFFSINYYDCGIHDDYHVQQTIMYDIDSCAVNNTAKNKF